jgi:hypothetical protein
LEEQMRLKEEREQREKEEELEAKQQKDREEKYGRVDDNPLPPFFSFLLTD